MNTDDTRKRVARYKELLAAKEKAKAPADRLRLFRKKMKRFQRRLRKLAKPAPQKEDKKEEGKTAEAPAAEKK